MGRGILIALVVGAVAVGAYLLLGNPGDDAAVTEPIEGAVEDAAEAAEDAEDVVDDAVGAAEDAVESLSDDASDAVEALEDAANSAAEAATGAAEEALDTATEAIGGAATAAEDAVTSSLPAFLTPEGFDPAAARDAVAGSDLGAVQKAALEAAITAAEANPDMIGDVVSQLRTALGL